MRTIVSITFCGVLAATASASPLEALEGLSAGVEAFVLERMPGLEGQLFQHRKGQQKSKADILKKAVQQATELTQDDPKAYCQKNPGAGCCKQVVPVAEECEQYFKDGLDPAKLCPSSCAASIRAIAKSLPGSGEKDGVCAMAIQGISLVDLGCAKATDGGYCFNEVNNIGLLLNETDPSPSKVEESIGSICDSSGSTDGTCFQQLTDSQDEIYALMEELLTEASPWGNTDDQYPYDDDAASSTNDDAAPGNPLTAAVPILRGLDLFCNRVEVAPLSPKNPFCIVHLLENTTIFGHDDDAQPSPDHIIEQLADPCARSFFASVSGTDPVAVSVASYGNGKREGDGALCGVATGFGEVAQNLTDFCASEEGGSSTVFNVLAPGDPTCSAVCSSTIDLTVQALGCCSQEVLFETWYKGAVPAGAIPSKVRPPMDAWIYRVATTCNIELGVFSNTCGFGQPMTVTEVKAIFTNSKAGYLSLNQTEAQEFESRLCVQAERTTGAPAGGCKATMPPQQDPKDPENMIVPLSIQFENRQQAAAAASLLENSPPSARAAAKYLERRPKSLYDAARPVHVTFSAEK